MSEQLKLRLNDSKAIRWGALVIVAFTMMAAYYVNDVVAPLKTMLETNLGWDSTDFGFYTGGYSFLNVFFMMLIWGGLILDRFGIRFTGKLATILMVGGTALEYYAMTGLAGPDATIFGMNEIFGYKAGVFVAFAGYSIFGVGAEVAGITVTKIIAKWFKGKELATAMGVQVALARIGSQAGYAIAIPMANAMGLSAPVLLGLILLLGGMVAFFVFAVMDKKLDMQKATATEEAGAEEEEEKFSFKDVKNILVNPGFWLIALLCVLFYSCVFPFQKFASELMIIKYGIAEEFAGTLAGLPALGALFLTPIFGGFIDKRGKSASIMILGSAMLIGVHFVYALPAVNFWLVAIVLMIILGIAFSLVPSAMWPAVAKIFPVSQLGTAYALIFFIQNIGLWGIPTLIGKVLDVYCIVGQKPNGANIYDYTIPMCIFTGIACLSLVVAFFLKKADKENGYRLEEPNIRKA
ncbi:MFS transporter [Bacteroides sp. UBA939]|uniref:MFS transporter n=1 Tax=Bacteroides sp. UBA939 TaxID=1946092 RepID=UPI0025BD0B3D|nr:MFS transporter [Bacteroides sp. UBA939]